MSCRLPAGMLAVVFLVSWTSASPARAAAPGLTWANYLGFNQNDVFGDILRDSTTGDVLITGMLPPLSEGIPADMPQDGLPGQSRIVTARFSANGTWQQWRALGGIGTDGSRAIAERKGRLFIAGHSSSTSFGTNAAGRELLLNGGSGRVGQNGLLAQLDPQTLQTQWVYLIDIDGRTEVINDLAIMENGDVVVVGVTVLPSGSTDTPTQDADAFVIRLGITSTGTGMPTVTEKWRFVSSAGTSADVASAIALDQEDNIYVAGRTASDNMFKHSLGGKPHTVSKGDDAFILKWAQADKDFIGGTYFGGTGEDEVASMVIRDGDIFVAGSSTSTELPGTPASTGVLGALKKAFVAKFEKDSLANLTTLTLGNGSTGNDEGRAVALVGKHVYVGGLARSPSFPGKTSAKQKGFVAKVELGELVSSVKESSILGGNGNDAVLSLSGASLAEGQDVLYVGGITTSSDLGPPGPPVSRSYSSESRGGEDLFLGRLDLGEDAPSTPGGGSPGDGENPVPRSPLGFSCGANVSGGGPGEMALLSLLGLSLIFASRYRRAPRE